MLVILTGVAAPMTPKSRPCHVKVVPVSSSPQENLPVEASQARVWASASQSVKPEPKVWEAEAYPVTSKAPESEALVPANRRPPRVRVLPFRATVVAASTVIAFTNSSKSRELEVTKWAPLLKSGFVEKVQVPVTVSFCESEAGPPAPQSRRTKP
jgi:hypothetical protein